jgi:hypothetical protein
VATPTTPEAIAQSGDLSAIFGLQTTDQAGENEIFARGKYNAPETTQARLTNFVSEMDGDTRLAYEAFAAIHSGVKLSDLPEKMRSAFFRQFNNGNRFTTDEAANTFVKDLGNLGRHFHTSQERNAFLQLMKQGYQSRKDATSQAEQAQREAETQRYRHEAELALRNANPRREVTDNNGRTTIIGGDDPSEEQVNALARIMQGYGLPVDKAVEIFRNNESLAQLHQMNAEKFRTISQMYGTAFTGLSMPEQAAFLKYYNDFATRYQEIVGDKTDSSQLSAEQKQQLLDLAQRWHQLTWDAGERAGEKVNLPFSFAPLVAELEAESAQEDITTFSRENQAIWEALERNKGDWTAYYREYTGTDPNRKLWDRLAAATSPGEYTNILNLAKRFMDTKPEVISFYETIFPKLLEYQRLARELERERNNQQQFRLQANPPQPRFRYVPSSSTR